MKTRKIPFTANLNVVDLLTEPTTVSREPDAQCLLSIRNMQANPVHNKYISVRHFCFSRTRRTGQSLSFIALPSTGLRFRNGPLSFLSRFKMQHKEDDRH